jgi:drug/metabolite transporter (DMT)-like permease
MDTSRSSNDAHPSAGLETKHLFAWLSLLNVLWAPVNLLVKIAIDDGASPTAIARIRWIILAILLSACLTNGKFRALSKAKFPSIQDGLIAVVLGFCFFGPSHVLYYFAITKTSTFEGNILGTTSPLWVTILSYIFLRERVSRTRALSIGIGFAGAYVVSVGFALPTLSDDHTLGNALYLAATVMEAICGVLIIQIARRSSGITALWLQVVGAAVALALGPELLPGIFEFRLDSVGLPTIGVLFYLIVICGMFAFGVWYSLAERAPLTLMVITLLIQPPLATLLGVIFLHETPTWNTYFGSALILSALLLGVRSGSTHLALTDEVPGSQGNDHEDREHQHDSGRVDVSCHRTSEEPAG